MEQQLHRYSICSATQVGGVVKNLGGDVVLPVAPLHRLGEHATDIRCRGLMCTPNDLDQCMGSDSAAAILCS